MLRVRVALVLSIPILLLQTAPPTQAAVIGVNFSSGRSTTDVNPVTGSAGVVSQSNWNNVTGNTSSVPTPLVDDSNLPTTAAISTFTATNSYSVYNATQTDQDKQLLNSYLDNTNAATPTSITVTGVPYSQYDVIVYVGSDTNGRTGHATIGSTSLYYSTQTNYGASTFPGYVQSTATTLADATSANYVRFTGLTDSSFTLTNVRDGNNTGVHGFQIVQTPEPASAALLGIASLGLLARRRRA